MKIISLGAHFLEPYYQPEATIVSVDLQQPADPQIDGQADATFAFAMNTPGGENTPKLWAAREACTMRKIPTVFMTIEDPNSFGTFLQQAAGFDVICTSDAEMIPQYRDWYSDAHVIWLPLAAQPTLHQPRPTAADATHLIFIGNWYTNEARLAAVRTLLDPLLVAGFTFSLYAYAHPAWPAKYRRWWCGATSSYDVATYYPHGLIALGMNNQAWGTAMCSMRTFEVLACGRPFLSFHSDAYERLGFVNAGPDLKAPGHFVWVSSAADAVRAAENLQSQPGLAAAIAARGRRFVLDRHTYAHRLRAILEALP